MLECSCVRLFRTLIEVTETAAVCETEEPALGILQTRLLRSEVSLGNPFCCGL